MEKKRFKSCFVSYCNSTTVTTPNKAFVTVPKHEILKRKWFQAVRKPFDTKTTVYFCCEDHFDFDSDMEDYMRYKMVGGNIKLKTNVVPHKFNWPGPKTKKRKMNESEREPESEPTRSGICNVRTFNLIETTRAETKASNGVDNNLFCEIEADDLCHETKVSIEVEDLLSDTADKSSPTPREMVLKRKIAELEQSDVLKSKKIRNLLKILVRQKKEISCLKETVAVLKNKKWCVVEIE